MVMLKAQLTIDPKHTPAFLHHMHTLIHASLAEQGCISFGCYEDTLAPNSFLVLEQWDSHASLDQHEQSDHLATFKAHVGGMILSRQETQLYSVSHIESLQSRMGK